MTKNLNLLWCWYSTHSSK